MGNLQILGTAYKFIKINARILLLLSLFQNVIALCVVCHTLCSVRKPPILLRKHNHHFVFSRYHCKEQSLMVVWVAPPWMEQSPARNYVPPSWLVQLSCRGFWKGHRLPKAPRGAISNNGMEDARAYCFVM